MSSRPIRSSFAAPARRRPAAGLLVGLAGLALSLIAWQVLTPLVAGGSVYLFLIPAAVAASAMGGLLPGLLVAMAGGGAGLMLAGAPGAGEALNAFIFMGSAAALAIGGEWFQRTANRVGAVNAALAEREAHLRSILETVPDAMIVIDEAGLIHTFSHTAGKIAGGDTEVLTTAQGGPVADDQNTLKIWTSS